MTPFERVAFALVDKLGGLDAAAMARHPAFVRALAAALAVGDEASVIAQVVAQGGLAHARNPHAVVVRRLSALPGLTADRRRIADELAESARWRQVDRAAGRGETLRALVERGDLFADEAERMVADEFADADLRGIAMAPLAGGAS